MEDDALTRRVTACCHAVHRELGAGYLENTYRAAVTRELEATGLAFTREERLPVLYHGEEIDRICVDFVIEHLLLLVRSKPALEKEDVSRTQASLRASGLARALVVNFGADELQVKKIQGPSRSPLYAGARESAPSKYGT